MKDVFDRSAVLFHLPLEFRETLGKFAIFGEQPAQLHKGADDLQAGLHGEIAFQDAREHQRAVLGEDQGQFAPPAMTLL